MNSCICRQELVQEVDKLDKEGDIKDQSIKIVNHLKGLINNVYQNQTNSRPFETAEMINNNELNSVRDKENEPAPPLQILEQIKPTNNNAILATTTRIIATKTQTFTSGTTSTTPEKTTPTSTTSTTGATKTTNAYLYYYV